jgi:hypothetical protein
MAITADRGGVTSPRWYQTGIPVSLRLDEELTLRFCIDSKGGGKTDLKINVATDSYESLITGMLECDFDGTIRAIARSLIAARKKSGR